MDEHRPFISDNPTLVNLGIYIHGYLLHTLPLPEIILHTPPYQLFRFISKWRPTHPLPAAPLALSMKAKPRVNSNKLAMVHTTHSLEIDYSSADGRSRGLHFTARALYQAFHPVAYRCNWSPLHQRAAYCRPASGKWLPGRYARPIPR